MHAIDNGGNENSAQLEILGQVALATTAVLATLWAVSPGFRAGVKAAISIATGNSAAQDLYQSWVETAQRNRR